MGRHSSSESLIRSLMSLQLNASRAFLGVERSFTGKAWRDRLDGSMAMQALAIAQRHGLPELLARILAGRGVTAETAEAFLDPSIRRHMPDPSALTDMEFAASRLARAVVNRERVAIFGDYDVDGATSSALLASWLRELDVEAAIHIPDRITEGYGPNIEAIRALKAGGADLLITVDCGTMSHDALREAQRIGFDTLVIDHHQAGERLPEAVAIVNPNRLDDLSGQGHLAACGVVFMLLVATQRALRLIDYWKSRAEPDLLAALDLVALGTVADVVPLTGLNRAYVARGLAVMRQRRRVGLRALMDLARLDGPPRPYHLGFLLGPRINAGGRIGEAGLGARLLMTQDETEAREIAATLDRLNRERQTIEMGMLAEAMAEAEAAMGLAGDCGAIVTASDTWHPGVVGLVAARLKERFGRPAFALAFGPDGVAAGSGRSIFGIDLGQTVRSAVETGLLVKGGGHAMAAGVTITRHNLGSFRAFLDERLGGAVKQARASASLKIDGAIQAKAASLDLMAMIERAEPFGQGNPEPVFALPAHEVAFADQAGASHVRLRLRGGDGAMISGVAFQALGQPLGEALIAHRGKRIHAAGTLVIDRWGNRDSVQLRLIDAAPADAR